MQRARPYNTNGGRLGGRRRNPSEEQRRRERYAAQGQMPRHMRPAGDRKPGQQPKIGGWKGERKERKRSKSRSRSKPSRSPTPRRSPSARRSPSPKRRKSPSPAPPPRGRSPSPVRRPVRERDRPQEDEWARQGAGIGGVARQEAIRQWGYGRETSAEAHARRNKDAYDLSRHAPSPSVPRAPERRSSPPRAPAPVIPQPQAAPEPTLREDFVYKEPRKMFDMRTGYRDQPPAQRRKLRISQM